MSSRKTLIRQKKNSFSFIEVLVGIVLLSLVATSLALPFKTLIQKIKFEKEVELLQGQLQMAYDLVQETEVDIDILFYGTKDHLTCELFCENLELLKKIKRKVHFQSISKISISDPLSHLSLSSLEKGRSSSQFKILVSYYGGRQKFSEVRLNILGFSQQKLSLLLKNFPHVLEIEKK